MSIRSFLAARGVNYDSLSKATKFFVFIGQLVDFGKITEAHYHEYFGKIDSLPECCIKFFIECRNKGIEPFATSLSFGQPPGIYYAMCPKCIKEYKNGTGRRTIS